MPKVFKELDPAVAEQLIAGYENELVKEYEAQEALYARQRCPECGNACDKTFLSIEHSLPSTAMVPRNGMRCVKCGCTFDPHTGIVTKTSEAAKDKVLARA